MEPLGFGGVKRSWETADQWIGSNKNVTAENAGPLKKACISRLSSSSAFAAPGAASFGGSVASSSPQTIGSGDATFSKSTFGSTYFTPLTYDTSFSQPQLSDSSWQIPIPVDQYPFGAQGTMQIYEEFHCSSRLENHYTNEPGLNFAPLDVLPGQDSWASSQFSEYGPQTFPITLNQTTITPTQGAYDANLNDDRVMYSDSASIFHDGDGMRLGDEHQDGISSATPHSTPRSIAEGDVATPATSNKTPNRPLYDCCFGVLLLEEVQVREDLVKKNGSNPIILAVNGSMVTIKDIESKYAGLLGKGASRVVSGLIRDHNVELSASIRAPKRIEVIVYGRREQGEPIGDMLSEQGYFLQQPDSYDASRPYYNPQYLFDPDEDMVFEEYTEAPMVRGTAFYEDKKSKVAELFDSATGPTEFTRVPISDILITKLKEYQTKALSMMVEKELGIIRDAKFPSVWVEDSAAESHLRYYNTVIQNFAARKPQLCLGGLLADEMGLGKTLTTLALIATSVNKTEGRRRGVCGTLIVCPLTTLTCWQDQIKRHFKRGTLTYRVYHGLARDNDADSLRTADIVLTTYDTLKSRLTKKKSAQAGLESAARVSLHDMNWNRVVLDEAHQIRNRNSKAFEAANALKAKHRWCLTGTPIQNRLEDLGALVEFLRVGPFDNPSVFKNTFLTPIHSGQQRSWERLRLLVQSISLRRTKKALNAELKLPPRHEIIQPVSLNREEKFLYDSLKRHFTLAFDLGGSVMNAFQFILRLRQVCNHGRDLLPQSLRSWLDQASACEGVMLPRCEACDIILDEGNNSSDNLLSCFHQICQACLQTDKVTCNSTGFCPLCNPDITEKEETADVGLITVNSEDTLRNYRPSSKVDALLQNLHNDRETEIGSGLSPMKSVVFSSWTSMLVLIGKALTAKNFIYQRLDGSMSLTQRQRALEEFRTKPDCTILLASLGSAAVGLDLTVATRVHLMEPGWNPLLEQQAMDRVHRLGQEREVLATRYIVSGPDSIEEYIQQRQEWKMDLIASSLNEPKARHNELDSMLKDMRRTICAKDK
ncbi:SNF2 family N-terminal domain-containing protein [Hypoxylon trugodes]|uniref:SNF2 family N-terminal domain-containing protein n=1 Tax=Hypoxylon trugodes TaxID=326681 RepID=UPI0021A23C98|nr:SNF2 family N-terminal domain-containing protein [Hypoxylon trugodes]KAI1386581.1 SNF2 family N-terminal domain-containing protein [Hypoxylon trugodes]